MVTRIARWLVPGDLLRWGGSLGRHHLGGPAFAARLRSPIGPQSFSLFLSSIYRGKV